ncbi:MAG: hypothetical protein EYC68_09710 [Chloroflexota bacterium]|nr:MAG: hypothetical protein EYC68_09710 [Chloroflexota bacterium]
MANHKIEKLEIHPLIKAQEPKGEPTIEFRGFVGTGDDGTLRLYMDLSMSSYIDIPKEGLVYVEKDSSGETGKVRAFVHTDQKVREVNKRTVIAWASALSATAFPTTDRFPLPELGGLIGCYNRCEAIFANQAADILQKRSRALLVCSQYGTSSIQCQQANAEAIDSENRAVGALHQCIEQCRLNAPRLFPFSPPVGEIVASIVKKYLG